MNLLRHPTFLALCSLSSLCGLPIEAGDSVQEKIALRRIAEYWEEGEEATATAQIRAFLHKYPESAERDQLYAMLGDVLFKKSQFAEALNAYNAIEGEEFQKKTNWHRIH